MKRYLKNILQKAISSDRHFFHSQTGTIALDSHKKNVSKLGALLLLGTCGYFMTKKAYSQQISRRYLWSWGGGKFGQLGLGDENNQSVPKLITDLEEFEIIDISCNSGVSAAITSEGRIYTWGRSKGGNLGHGETFSTLLNVPTPIESLQGKKFVQVSAGVQHIAAISDDYQLYTWGNTDHGKLGHSPNEMTPLNMKQRDFTPRNIHSIPLPQKVPFFEDKKVVNVSCGLLHTLALTDDGLVYSWGSKSKGVLGYETNSDSYTPNLVSALVGKNIVKIASGSDFNLALSSDGAVYAWGSNNYGQLGNSNNLYSVNPVKIRGFDSKIVDINCGENFSAALTEEGELYTWGYGSDGQLGQGHKADVITPKAIKFFKKVRGVSCGGSHSAIITQNGELYTFGRGREGQLGRGENLESNASSRTEPQLVTVFEKNNVLKVKCGGDHTLAIVE